MKIEELIDNIYTRNKDNPGIIMKLAEDFNLTEQRVRDIVLEGVLTEEMTGDIEE